MLKRLSVFVLCAGLLAAALPASAQMTDDAVIAYVKENVEQGKSQNEIARNLINKGVSKAQLERIQKKIEDEKVGQINPINSQEGRTRRIADLSEVNSEGNLVQEGDQIETATTETETAAQVQGIRVFGRDVFTNRNLTFAPNQNLATPENYKLGPGDEIIIDIWGTNQNTIRQTITPEGYINVPDLGLMSLNGMTVQEADKYLRRQLSRIYSALDGESASSDCKLTLGQIRTIQINVLGDVAVPGTYELSSFANVFHALYRAGGFSSLGGLRNVQLVRGGKPVQTIDMYDFILKGKSSDDLRLEDGDVVLVQPYEALVQVVGQVKRPMFYEMKEGETMKDVLEYAGGFTGNAYKSSINVVRQGDREYKVYSVKEDKYESFTLADGDSLTVGAILNRYENRIEIKGAVYRPGIYQLGEEIKTVKQLVAEADGLMGDAFTNRAVLHRQREDLTLEVMSFDVKNIINGSSQDIELQKNDILYIPSIHDLKDMGYISIFGEVASPGEYPYADNTTIEDLIVQAGGLSESASLARVDVARRIVDPMGTEASDTIGQTYTFSIKDGFIIDGEAGFLLEPYDQVYVRKSPSYRKQTTVTIEGEVLYEGDYALTKRNQRLSDLVAAAGGVTDWGYVKGARLVRLISDDERVRMRKVVDVMERGSRDTVDVEQLDLGSVYYVGINLEKAIAEPGSDYDVTLREGDLLVVPEYNNTVKISGAVQYPNVVYYNQNGTVKFYVEQAGGYIHRAKRSKAYVIYLNGTVAKARKVSKGVIEPGCEIIIPKKGESKFNLQGVMSVATTTASLATMMATIANIIK